MSGAAAADPHPSSIPAPLSASPAPPAATFCAFSPQALTPPPQPLTLLAFDFGLKRTGVATGNTLMRTAQPLRTVAAEGDARFKPIEALVQEWRPAALVVGIPFHPDGAPHDNTRRAQRFARQLRGRFGLPVYEVDERWSTTEALSDLREGEPRSACARDADAAAAAILLEQYFRESS